MADNRFFPLAAAQQNLKRLLLIRLIVFICQGVALFYTWSILGLELEYGFILSVLLLVLVVNSALLMRLDSTRSITDVEFSAHLLFDILTLALLLYLSGGANNPFVSFFLVPITISAAILPWMYTWVLTGISLVAYSLLLFIYQPLPELMPMGMAQDGSTPNLHIIGMWFNFLVSAVLITFFVVKMAVEIRKQEDALSHYREENMRNEQILAVATQAAGTAHELGTPLNTMALLVREMTHDCQDPEQLKKDLNTLETQIDVCKHSLKSMVNRADFRHAGLEKTLPVTVFIEQVREQWSLMRPEVSLTVLESGTDKAPTVSADATLQQAIVNIMNNAADASPEGIDLEIDWDDEKWILKVRDYGDGINEEVVQYLGTEIISDKDKGMGVGVILSQASINRLGGRVIISSHPEKGTVTEIQMPVQYRVKEENV